MDDLDAVFEGTRKGYVYTRYGNPTVTALEEAVAALEEGEAALAFASGMAAIHAALLAVGARAGSAVVAAQDIYGATYSLLAGLLRSQGVTVHFVDTADLDAVEAACAELEPVALLAETVSNPLLKVADLPALADVAHRHGAALLVDHTFATPCLAQPLKMGTDVVIHSSTKYLGGHGDALSGIVVTSEKRRADMFEVLKVTGGNLGPQEAWLTLRGIKTLPLRMRQHCENAQKVAEFLESHGQVEWVRYPGLKSHPQYEVGCKQMSGPGGIVSFGLKGGLEAGRKMMNSVELCRLAVSLGGVETLIQHPASMTHASMGREARERANITDGLVRVSVGIENADDIIADLEQALAKATSAVPRSTQVGVG